MNKQFVSNKQNTNAKQGKDREKDASQNSQWGTVTVSVKTQVPETHSPSALDTVQQLKPLKANHYTLRTPCSNNWLNKCECKLIVNNARTDKGKQRDTAGKTQSLNGKII